VREHIGRSLTLVRLVLVGWVIVAVALPAASAEDQIGAAIQGPTESDRIIERFLLEGEILLDEEVGEGITNPHRLTLKHNAIVGRAIFKTHDEVNHEVTFTSMAEIGFADRYVYEIAAYRLDRMLGLNLVPVTVLRTVNGEEGSLQYWIEDAIHLQKAMDDGISTRDPARFVASKQAMQVLDALIFNIDRNPSNILITPGDDGFHLIDHSRAFRVTRKLPPWSNVFTEPLPVEITERLRLLDRDVLTEVLGSYLSPKQIKTMLKRRDLLIDYLKSEDLL
jgi:hypothetical protein